MNVIKTIESAYDIAVEADAAKIHAYAAFKTACHESDVADKVAWDASSLRIKTEKAYFAAHTASDVANEVLRISNSADYTTGDYDSRKAADSTKSTKPTGRLK